MFTGIIEELGTVRKVNIGRQSCIVEIECKKILEDTKIGASISTNGVCLTVTSKAENSYTADVMPETVKRSSLGSLKSGDNVNLERAMSLNGRFGGHMVSGHIDGTGIIKHIKSDDNALWYTISTAKEILRYIVEKGSITVDGISLTVASVTEQEFKISIIPHTQVKTNLHYKKQGEVVNIECDIVGKYIEKFITEQTEKEKTDKRQSKITEGFLHQNGF